MSEDNFKRWSPTAQDRAYQALRDEVDRPWRPFYCPNPLCNGRPHGPLRKGDVPWDFDHARQDQRAPMGDWLTWGAFTYPFVFLVTGFTGTPPASNPEGTLEWVDVDRVLELPLWEGDRHLRRNLSETVIYEMHVRGFTNHTSSNTKYPGTFAAIREKIPYLKELGVNCIELMPIFEFDEFEYDRMNPLTGERLVNYWGYSTVGFFAPKAGYAATGRFGMAADELKTLVKELHKNDIEIILDVVFNHTAEGNELGPTISFRGIDNASYYRLNPHDPRLYTDYTGCGNTLESKILRRFFTSHSSKKRLF